MLFAFIVSALSLAPLSSANALPLRLQGRTVALTAAQLGRTCVTCQLLRVTPVADDKPAPSPPPLLVPNEDPNYTPPPLVDSDQSTPPAGELTPPPDAPSWQKPPPEAKPTQEVRGDPNAGQIVPKEVVAGALTLVLTDVLALGTVVGIVLLAAASGAGSVTVAVGAVFVAIGVAIVHALLAPLWCALAVRAIADEPTENGLGGAALGSYGAALSLGVITLVISLTISLASAGLSGGTGQVAALDAVGSLVTLVAVFARWIGLPFAASWAMHRGTPRPQPSYTAALHPRREVTVGSDGREARALGGATLFAF